MGLVSSNLRTVQRDNELSNSDLDVNIMKTTISILIFLMISFSTFGQESLTFLKNWNIYPVPENIMRYNSAENDWVVYLDRNEIRTVDDRSYTYKKNLGNKKLPFKIEHLSNLRNYWMP